MAAPTEITIRNLSGRYTMNKTLSDSQDPILSLQGIGWVTRKAVQIATVTLVIKGYEEDSILHVDITSTASGLSSSQENRVCNWQERDHADKLFGNVRGKSKMTKASEYQPAVEGVTNDEKDFMLGKKLKDGSPSAFLNDEFLQSVAFSQDGMGWGVDQLWGFETVNGERRYTRRLVCKNKGKTQILRLVYDYNGPIGG